MDMTWRERENASREMWQAKQPPEIAERSKKCAEQREKFEKAVKYQVDLKSKR